MYDSEKLKEIFPTTTVYKDPAVMAIFKAEKLEAFLRDWILKRKADENGRIADFEELSDYVQRIIPHRKEKESLEDEARSEGITRPFLAKINISFNPKSNYYCFELPDLGFSYNNTLIEDYVWDRIKQELIGEAGGWGLIKLGYLPPEGTRSGKFTLLEYTNFCPYEVNLEAFKEARARFDNTEEWMDVLLGAIDYNADGFVKEGDVPDDTWLAKHTMLSRLLPFVQPRINLFELAPQMTGKSYIFGKISKYGWLAGGGSLSRAKLFLDMRPGAKTSGLVTFTDYVAIDEIKSIKFTNDKEMAGILKGYMEDGFVNVGGTKVEGEAGMIFLGNIDVENMSSGMDMFVELPEVFRDSALLQRIHGFIPGYRIPVLSPKMRMNGWALNTEYFSEIMHLMRSSSETMRYRAFVEELIEAKCQDNESISVRELESIIRLCTGYMKLFFPHANSDLIKTIEFKKEFKKYCLDPAVSMQETVLEQMKIINPHEFGKKNMATYTIRS
jgi:ATP-dependent Lon protease